MQEVIKRHSDPLYIILDELELLFSERADLAAGGEIVETEEGPVPLLTPEQIATRLREINGAIEVRMGDLMEKTDRIHGALRELQRSAASDRVEKYRLDRRIAAAEDAQEHIKAHVLGVMAARGIRQLKGEHVTISRRSYTPPVEIVALDKVPAKYTRVTVTLPGDVWQAAIQAMPELVPAITSRAKVEPSKKLIAAAMDRAETVDGADRELEAFTLICK